MVNLERPAALAQVATNVYVALKEDSTFASQVRDAEVAGPFGIAAGCREDVPRVSARAGVAPCQPCPEGARAFDLERLIGTAARDMQRGCGGRRPDANVRVGGCVVDPVDAAQHQGITCGHLRVGADGRGVGETCLRSWVG